MYGVSNQGQTLRKTIGYKRSGKLLLQTMQHLNGFRHKIQENFIVPSRHAAKESRLHQRRLCKGAEASVPAFFDGTIKLSANFGTFWSAVLFF